MERKDMEVNTKSRSIPFRIFKGLCTTVILALAAYGALTLISQSRKPAERIDADMAASLREKGIHVAPEGLNSGYSPVFGVVEGLAPLEGGSGGNSQVPGSLMRYGGGSPNFAHSEPETKLTMEHSAVDSAPLFGHGNGNAPEFRPSINSEPYGNAPSFTPGDAPAFIPAGNIPQNAQPISPPSNTPDAKADAPLFSPDQFQVPEPPAVNEPSLPPAPQDRQHEIGNAPLFNVGGNTENQASPENNFITPDVDAPVFDPYPSEIPAAPELETTVIREQPVFPFERTENIETTVVPVSPPNNGLSTLSHAPPFEPAPRSSEAVANTGIITNQSGAMFRALPPIEAEKELEIAQIARMDDPLVNVNRERPVVQNDSRTNPELRQVATVRNDFSSNAIRTAEHEAFDPFNLDPPETRTNGATTAAPIPDRPSGTAGTARVGNGDAAGTRKNIRKSVYDSARQMSDAIEKGHVLQGYSGLTQLYGNQELSYDEREMLLPLLDNLAREVIYSDLHIMEKSHLVRTGETVESVAKHYEITPELLINLNGLKGAARLKPGMELKVVRGPFHAIISLEKKEIQLELNGYYAGRFRTGIGGVDKISKGTFAVIEKRKNPPYSGPEGAFTPGSRDNPYGAYALTLAPGLAIHGTNAPETVGTWHNTSPGFNLADRDIRDVFGILTTDSVVIIR